MSGHKAGDVSTGSSGRSGSRGRDIAILVFALFFPTALTYAYFVWGQTTAPGAAKFLYLAGKTIQFAFPALVVSFILKERVLARPFNWRGVLMGSLFGIIVGATIFLLGRYGLTSPSFSESEFVLQLRREFSSRVVALGLASTRAFLVTAIFYSIIHSGLEEYYWRWFTFGRVSRFVGILGAVSITNIAFTLHHVVVLGVYFGYDNILTWLCSLGVFVGGVVWQTIYYKNDSIYGGWISHGFVDAGIYGIGFLMLPS